MPVAILDPSSSLLPLIASISWTALPQLVIQTSGVSLREICLFLVVAERVYHRLSADDNQWRRETCCARQVFSPRRTRGAVLN